MGGFTENLGGGRARGVYNEEEWEQMIHDHKNPKPEEEESDTNSHTDHTQENSHINGKDHEDDKDDEMTKGKEHGDNDGEDIWDNVGVGGGAGEDPFTVKMSPLFGEKAFFQEPKPEPKPCLLCFKR